MKRPSAGFIISMTAIFGVSFRNGLALDDFRDHTQTAILKIAFCVGIRHVNRNCAVLVRRSLPRLVIDARVRANVLH